jgi:hypothetical protein
MPHLNSLEAATDLKREMRNVPVILFTMHEDAVRLQCWNLSSGQLWNARRSFSIV